VIRDTAASQHVRGKSGAFRHMQIDQTAAEFGYWLLNSIIHVHKYLDFVFNFGLMEYLGIIREPPTNPLNIMY
jgi:hypothetical protein